MRRTDGLATSLQDPAVQGATPMTETYDYRERADRCEKDATVTLNFEIKAQLERIAQYWRDLALLAERRIRER
jgi:hypothetical protein